MKKAFVQAMPPAVLKALKANHKTLVANGTTDVSYEVGTLLLKMK